MLTPLSVMILSILFLASTLLWGIPWNRFTEAAKKTKAINVALLRQTAIKVGIGSLGSGLILAILGFIIEADSGTLHSMPLLLLGLAIIPIGFVVLILCMFLLKAAALKTMYEAEVKSQSLNGCDET
jgi:ABC-type enterobactin transport system permease subunit